VKIPSASGVGVVAKGKANRLPNNPAANKRKIV